MLCHTELYILNPNITSISKKMVSRLLVRRLCFVMASMLLMVFRLGAVEPNSNINVTTDIGGFRLSEEALASIADIDDHPVEDTDAARADRMLAALESLPEHERISMGLGDMEALRSTPLEERLVKLQDIWVVRQAELREAYEAMPKVNEVLTKIISILRDPDASEAALVTTLYDLEDLLGDIDMARDFHTLGGFPILTSTLLESHPESVREMAAWVIGTAVKNQPDHQLWVLEGNQDGPESQPSALDLLLRNAEVATTSSLRSKIVYALSACVSNNGQVQLQFGSLRGEAVLAMVYDADGSDSRVKMKILTLLSDLLNEAARGSPAAALATVPVGSTATSGAIWCSRVDEALRQASSPVALEKVLEALLSLAPSCRDQFRELETKESLEGLAQQCRSSPPREQDEIEFHEELARQLEECAIALR